jgi:hypothetical protein
MELAARYLRSGQANDALRVLTYGAAGVRDDLRAALNARD